MNKKGFTLIELLAVIVILAIIALIATPAVLNIIEDSKESAAKDSAMTISKAAETYYVSNVVLQGEEALSIDLTKDTLEFKGKKPEKGYLEFDEQGNSYLKMYMNGYCIVSDYDNTVVSEKMDSEECNVPSATSLRLFEDGEEVYFNPVKNIACKDTDYVTSNSDKNYVGTEENGCLKWYAFLDTEDAMTVKLLSDHNTTALSAWNEDTTGDTTKPVTALVALADDVDGWDDSIKSTARLMKAVDVHEVVLKYASTVETYGTRYLEWTVSDSYTWYRVTTGEIDSYDGITNGPHKLGWLFERTSYDCTTYGCYNDQEYGEYGYWLEEYSHPITGEKHGWLMDSQGTLTYGFIEQAENHGIRPVIEVSKTKFTN